MKPLPSASLQAVSCVSSTNPCCFTLKEQSKRNKRCSLKALPSPNGQHLKARCHRFREMLSRGAHRGACQHCFALLFFPLSTSPPSSPLLFKAFKSHWCRTSEKKKCSKKKKNLSPWQYGGSLEWGTGRGGCEGGMFPRGRRAERARYKHHYVCLKN